MSEMIIQASGNLLKAPVEALVNTVNTEGVMGKGIALQFKNAFPLMFESYATASKRGDVVLGTMHVWPTGLLERPKYVINFPTKGHWRAKSRIADIESGLADLVRVIRELGIESIAVPPLGCGNGGLRWSDVEPVIRRAFEPLADVDVHLFAPAGAPAAVDMPVNTLRPRMTPGRAALVGIVARYTRQAMSEPSIVEAQKLMYFLQLLGEPLRLNFEANRYGPYADSLRHVLAQVEGHFLSGYGDGSNRVSDGVPLSAVESAVPEVEALLQANPSTRSRMERVLDLVDGYESAYGMELLATVHWIAREESNASDRDLAERVAEWSPRKARMFTPDHVSSALATLRSHGLLAAS